MPHPWRDSHVRRQRAVGHAGRRLRVFGTNAALHLLRRLHRGAVVRMRLPTSILLLVLVLPPERAVLAHLRRVLAHLLLLGFDRGKARGCLKQRGRGIRSTVARCGRHWGRGGERK